MGQLSSKLRNSVDNGLAFWCPGCNTSHRIQYGSGDSPRWTWDGDAVRPTFTPSVLVTSCIPSDDPNQFDDSEYDVPTACHSYVTDGRIQFLNDCTHPLAGHTVDLPDWPASYLMNFINGDD